MTHFNFSNLRFPMIMLASIVIAYMIEPYLAQSVKVFFYSVSLSIKNFILTFIPFIVFIFLSSSLTKIGEGVIKFALTLFMIVFFSNYVAIIFGASYGHIIADNIPYMNTITNQNPLSEEIVFPNLAIIRNEYAILLGILAAFIILKFKINHDLLSKAEHLATEFLRVVLIPLVPLFIFGFIIKFRNDGILENISSYGYLLLLFTIGILLYNLILLTIASFVTKLHPLKIIKTILPACTVGFTTFSSVAAMPVTISCLNKLTTNKSSAKMVIPATVSVHIVSTAVGMNIVIASAFAIFGVALPSLSQYLLYALFYAVTMFAVVAVPGGSVFVLAPIISHYLGASPSMIAFITATILVFDPIDTCFNIFSNSMLTLIIDKTKMRSR